MKISFDLDETLICGNPQIQREKQLKFPWNFFYRENLRKGIVELSRKLNEIGFDICIYTTSNRPIRYIRNLIKHYGIKLDLIINNTIHLKLVQGNKQQRMPSKYPSKFRIDLHIDDDITVKQNGDMYGFKVLIIKPEDQEWASKIIESAKKIIK